MSLVMKLKAATGCSCKITKTISKIHDACAALGSDEHARCIKIFVVVELSCTVAGIAQLEQWYTQGKSSSATSICLPLPPPQDGCCNALKDALSLQEAIDRQGMTGS